MSHVIGTVIGPPRVISIDHSTGQVRAGVPVQSALGREACERRGEPFEFDLPLHWLGKVKAEQFPGLTAEALTDLVARCRVLESQAEPVLPPVQFTVSGGLPDRLVLGFCGHSRVSERARSFARQAMQLIMDVHPQHPRVLLTEQEAVMSSAQVRVVLRSPAGGRGCSSKPQQWLRQAREILDRVASGVTDRLVYYESGGAFIVRRGSIDLHVEVRPVPSTGRET